MLQFIMGADSVTLTKHLRLVRDQAFKAVDLFVKRLETHASTMVCNFLIK